METDYFVFTSHVSSSGDVITSDEKWFTTYGAALKYFYLLVGCSVMSMSDAVVSSTMDDSYFKLKARITSRAKTNNIFVYLRKLS